VARPDDVMMGRALTHLSDEQLERLLKAVHRGVVDFPLDGRQLMLAGFADIFDRASFLHGLDEAGVKAVLLAVLAERRRRR
jgi:hypothetical protein